MPALSPTTSSCRVAASRCLGLAVAVLAVAALAAPVAGAAEAKYEGISADGKVAIFSTAERLVPGDTDSNNDVYERSFDSGIGDYVTRQVSIGPIGGNNPFNALYYGVDPLGSAVFFSTTERLTPDDIDRAPDVYMRDLITNTTTRVTRGASTCEPGCGNSSDPASPVPGGVSSDGSTVFFATAESLGPEDGDASLDVYASDVASGSTTLVSRGASDCELSDCGRGVFPAFFQGASESGQKAFFTTAEGLVAGEGDGQVDIYERDLGTGTTRLVSVAGTCPGDLPPGQNCDPTFGGVSGDGSHVFFETNDRISLQDTDSSQDVYDWSDGVATRASTGPDGGNGTANALFAGSSPSGDSVFFETDESLLVTDTDGAQDIYQRSAGETRLISSGAANCGGSSCDISARVVRINGVPSGVFDGGGKVFFLSREKLAGEDEDEAFDVYMRDIAADTTTLVSQADSSCPTPGCGSGAFDADFARASASGSRAFFVTDESLVPADTDSRADVYERSGGVTTLVSAGADEIYGNGPFDAQLHGVSEDGSRAFFVTKERMAQTDDFLGENDVYMRSSGGTLLVSVGNDPTLVLGPPPPALQGTDPPSPNPSTQPAIVGQAAAGALIKIYTNPDCTGELAAKSGTAEQLASPGLPVTTVAVGSRTGFWATAEAEGIISPCSAGIFYTQQSESTQPPPPGDPPPDSGTGGGGDSGDGDSGTGTGSTGGLPRFHSGGIAFVTPKVQITFGPAFKTRKRRAVFRFVDATGQPGTRFICKRDRRRWRSCRSPARMKRLRPGKHRFAVKAVNAAGTWQARPIRRKFKVVR